MNEPRSKASGYEPIRKSPLPRVFNEFPETAWSFHEIGTRGNPEKILDKSEKGYTIVIVADNVGNDYLTMQLFKWRYQ
jgi:hypothetical protein